MQNNERKVVELNISDVLPNRFQPRIKFDENSINELALSIKKYGVIQPIVVRQIGEKYEIIAGERRYKASVMAGKTTIPAIIGEMSDIDSVEIALIENVQREDLTPIEKAVSYKKILDMGYINQEDLAQKVGKSQSSIANTLRLLNLSDEVQEALLENKISERHARSLLKVKDLEQQKYMLNRIIDERLTVRKTDEEIEKMNNGEINIINNDVPSVDQVVNIPDVAQVSDLSELPGFMDIEKIENEAKDIVSEEKPLADVDSLLQSSTPEVAEEEPLMPQGKFFNFFDVEDNNESNGQLQFDNFFTNQMNDTLLQPEVPTFEAVEPMYEMPMQPEVPAFETMEPTYEMPVQPEVPAFEALEPTYEMPMEPEVPAFEALEPMYEMPMEPEVPAFETMESTYEMPVQPEVPAFEALEPTYEMPMEPEVPAFEALEPTYEMPMQPEVPAFEAVEPTYEMPVQPEVPTFEAVEPMYEMPMEPEVPTFEAIEPMYEMPMKPEVPAFEAVEPTYEMPMQPEVPTFEAIEPTYEMPMQPEVPAFEAVEPMYEMPVQPEVPAFEALEPTYEMPVQPEVPAFEALEPTYEMPVQPEVPAFEAVEPMYEMPVQPEVPAFEAIEPTYEMPVQPEVPTFEVQSEVVEEQPIEPVMMFEPEQFDNMNIEEPENLPETNQGTTIKIATPNIRLAVNTVRECENTLNKYGFVVDVEEIDFEDSYQVIFKINK